MICAFDWNLRCRNALGPLAGGVLPATSIEIERSQVVAHHDVLAARAVSVPASVRLPIPAWRVYA